MAAPGIPANMVTQQGNGQVLISWDITAGATSYTVKRSLDNVTFSTLSSGITAAYHNDTTAVVGTQYWYKVAAVNSDGTGTYTDSDWAIPTYAGSLALKQIRREAQQRADMENSNFVSMPEWNRYINMSLSELYDLLSNVHEDYYLATAVQFTTDGTSEAYALPNGANYSAASPFKALVGVDLGPSTNANNARITIHKFQFIERNRYVFPNVSATFTGVFNMKYRVMGSNIRFIPIPSAGQTVTLWYEPRMVQLLNDTDISDGINGWLEYVIVDAAIKAKQKQEDDVSVLLAQKAALIKRIEESAINRDVGQPDKISNTRSAWTGGYGGPGSDGSYGGY